MNDADFVADETELVAVQDSAEDVKRMQRVFQLDDEAKKHKRKHDITMTDNVHINDKNKRFIKKAGKAYDYATEEVRDNLERGTAL